MKVISKKDNGEIYAIKQSRTIYVIMLIFLLVIGIFSSVGLIHNLNNKQIDSTYISEVNQKSVVKISAEVDTILGRGQATGSGVMINDKQVVTNQHVVAGVTGKTVDVAFPFDKDTEIEGRIVCSDEDLDLAIIELDEVPREAKPVQLSANLPSIGADVFAIGYPMGIGYSFTKGVVSSPEVESKYSSFSFIQFDAAVSPGNSGGGLFNDKNQLIGIVSQKIVAQGAENIGMAIPTSVLLDYFETEDIEPASVAK